MTHKTCDRCGELLKRPRMRLMLQAEYKRNEWNVNGKARYYCERCARFAEMALDAFEAERSGR